jgi:hypothetical protein
MNETGWDGKNEKDKTKEAPIASAASTIEHKIGRGKVYSCAVINGRLACLY